MADLTADEQEREAARPTFITLGPSGTCHEAALLRYLDFQGIENAEIVLVEDLLAAIDIVRERERTFLVQCSAHLQVHLVTERHFREVFVLDTFIYPTKELALLVRTDVADPTSLGIVSATRGYTDLGRWSTIVDEPSKPVVARHLLAGDYDAGPDPPALRRGAPPAATRRGVLRRGRHDLGRVRQAQALPRRGHRPAGAVAVRRRAGGRAAVRLSAFYAGRMAADARQSPALFDPTSFQTFRFLARELDAHGHVTLRYALDDEVSFVEELDLPIEHELDDAEREHVDGLLALLHWVAGVSYFKTALPPTLSCETGAPPPAAATLLEALYSEGLGELAYTNGLDALPRPSFPRANAFDPAPGSNSAPAPASGGEQPISRVLVPVGGGKDSAVALEIVRRSGLELALFSIGDAAPIARTVAAAGLPHLLARRRLDPGLAALNKAGAINGHVPVTAIVSCVALLSAALRGFDAVAMANERSASAGNVTWQGIDVNHQFSKGLRAERLLSAALAEAGGGGGGVRSFSILRPASELGIARAFARMDRYHAAFTSCNASFRIDPALRASSWCCDCPKCRFVFLALAPFSEPAHLRQIFGRDLLEEEDQFEGFSLLSATGGHKPFECVGEEDESLAAIRLLAQDPRWSGHRVLERLIAEVLPAYPPTAGDPDQVLALADEHDIPAALLADVHAILGA